MNCASILTSTLEYFDSTTGSWIDATGENWVSSFDTTSGILVIDYSQVDYDVDYPIAEVVTFDLRVTVSNSRSNTVLNSLIDLFSVTFSDNCSTDTLTLGAATTNIGVV